MGVRNTLAGFGMLYRDVVPRWIAGEPIDGEAGGGDRCWLFGSAALRVASAAERPW